jgi:hypothetical protein
LNSAQYLQAHDFFRKDSVEKLYLNLKRQIRKALIFTLNKADKPLKRNLTMDDTSCLLEQGFGKQDFH